MPLVILGIIVVVGACLMIYYQIGPTLRERARKAEKGYIHVEVVPKLPDEGDDARDARDEEKPYDKSGDGKVLYVFNGGKTEIRPLGKDSKDDPTDSDGGDVG
jgi:hypothetical protein